MAQNEQRDWKNEVSKQIVVYKTDKKLLELNDKLKPASKLFPAHIHAMGEEAEEGARSLIQIIMLDYSKGKGENTISVSAHINPEEAKFLYSKNFCGASYVDFTQEKIFGDPDEAGHSKVTKLSIKRFDTDAKGEKRRYPWIADIENGRGFAAIILMAEPTVKRIPISVMPVYPSTLMMWTCSSCLQKQKPGFACLSRGRHLEPA